MKRKNQRERERIRERENEEKKGRGRERITTSHLTGNKKQEAATSGPSDDSCHRNRNSEEKDSLSFFPDGNICEKRTILIVK